jgi:hypothetical protein
MVLRVHAGVVGRTCGTGGTHPHLLVLLLPSAAMQHLQQNRPVSPRPTHDPRDVPATRCDTSTPLPRVAVVPCWEVLACFLLCTLDMVTSAWLFSTGLATEANPLLRPFAEAGVSWFVGAKTLMFLPSLLLAEWQIRRKPEFFRPLLRWVGALYLGIYVLGVGAQLLR